MKSVLRQINHTPTCYFGNVDLILSEDLYQAQPIKDSFIFEKPIVSNQIIPYSFWEHEIKCYELHTTMRQKDIDFITILNKMRLNKQSDNDIQYINAHCYRSTPIDPLFPYLYYRNKDVHKHNDKMLSLVKEKLLVIEAIDELESNQPSYHVNL